MSEREAIRRAGAADRTRAELASKIAGGDALVGIIGLGYVGLPLALTFVEEGFRVLGFDVDPKKVEILNRGECYIRHVDQGRVAAARGSGRLTCTTDFSRLDQPDAVLICVPTPLTPQREPDLTFVEGSARQIRERLRPGQLVVLESTTYPGTTDELVKGVLEETGLRCGVDFFLAFSPEREDPGNTSFGTTTTPKVVGGVDEPSGDLAQALYDRVITRTVRVSSARAAEATKLMENIFRAVNIALVNELKVVYDRMGIDIWEVLDAAATKPFGFMRFNPGPGWGGHCIGAGEWVRVRGGGLDGPQRVGQLFDHFKHSSPAVMTRQGVFLQPEGLEALALDARSGGVEWFPVQSIYRGSYRGGGVRITTRDRRSLVVTDRHPMLVRNGAGFQVNPACDVRAGDEIPLCSDLGEDGASPEIDLIGVVPPAERHRVFVRIAGTPWAAHAEALKRRFGWPIRDSIRSDALRLDRWLAIEQELEVDRSGLVLLTGAGRARRAWPARLRVTPDFSRLVGYYLAEGCITEDRGSLRVRFTFNRDEHEAIADVRRILAERGFPTSVFNDATWHSTTIKASSLLLGWLLRDGWRCGTSSSDMRVPDLMFSLSPSHKRELLAGLLRGDGDVFVRSGTSTYRKNGKTYTNKNNTATVGFFSSSPALFEQAIHLLQDAGFKPRLKAGKPQLRIQGAEAVDRLASYFCDSKAEKLRRFAERRIRSVAAGRDSEQIAPGLSAIPVASNERIELDGPVYSLEVEGAATFTSTTGIVVHNCIPLDPFYLSWKAKQYGVAPKFIELAGDVNVQMPEYVVSKLQAALNDRGKAVRGSRVLVLGIAYKRDIDDPRESPAFEIIERLLKLGAEVSYHDPHIPVAPRMRTWPDLPEMRSRELTPDSLASVDAVIIVTDHRAVDYDLVARHAPLVVDTRGVYREARPNVVKA
jgi:UDP-N-acetyl-D-mannosaminuronate dehydrogenase/intein/homing endonuclease